MSLHAEDQLLHLLLFLLLGCSPAGAGLRRPCGQNGISHETFPSRAIKNVSARRTFVFVFGQLQKKTKDVVERGELLADLKLGAERDPEVHILLQRRVLHRPTRARSHAQTVSPLPPGVAARYLLAGGTGGVCGVQLEQEQHQNPQEAGGAQSRRQLDQHRQATVFGHVRQRVGEHVDNPRHHGVHVRRGIVGETAGLKTQVGISRNRHRSQA